MTNPTDENAPGAAPESVEDLARLVADLLREKKGEDVAILRMTDVLPVTDYFVIATGRNARHVDALVEEVEIRLKKLGIPTPRRAGKDTNWWVLLDYGAVVVHVFREEARRFYDLELLWADAEPMS